MCSSFGYLHLYNSVNSLENIPEKVNITEKRERREKRKKGLWRIQRFSMDHDSDIYPGPRVSQIKKETYYKISVWYEKQYHQLKLNILYTLYVINLFVKKTL